MIKIGIILEYPTDSNFYQFCLLSNELHKNNIQLQIYIPEKTLFFNKNNISEYTIDIPIIKYNLQDINNCNILIITNKIEKIHGKQMLITAYNLFENKKNILFIQNSNCFDICNYHIIGYRLKRKTLCRDEILTNLNLKTYNNINFPILENYKFKKEKSLSKTDFCKKYNLDYNKKIISIFLPHSMKISWVSIKNLLKNISKINDFLKTKDYQIICKLHIKQVIKNIEISYNDYIKFLNIPIIDNIYTQELYTYSSFAISIWSSNAYYIPCLNIPTLVLDLKCFCKTKCSCNFNNTLNLPVDDNNYLEYVLNNGKLCNNTFSSDLKDKSNHRKLTTNYYGYICFIEDFIEKYDIIFDIFLNKDYSICHDDNYKVIGNLNYDIEDYVKNLIKYINI